MGPTLSLQTLSYCLLLLVLVALPSQGWTVRAQGTKLGPEPRLATEAFAKESKPRESRGQDHVENWPLLECNVLHYGAVGDGVSFDTSAIQAAIDFCSVVGISGGGHGKVILPSGGRFLSATVFLRSHTTLHIEENATLLGSPDLGDFPQDRDRWYTVLGENVTAVRISGSGTIDGQAQKFVVEYNPRKNIMVSWNRTGQCLGDECRPRLVGFLDSSDVQVSGVHLQEPAYWCWAQERLMILRCCSLHLVRCRHTLITNISIYGDFNIPNNDGIDIDGSNHTLIEHVRIDTGDDAICPKSTAGPIANLTARHSWLRTKSCAVKLGSGSEHDFRDLHFEHLVIEDSHRGLGIQLRDQGSIYNVTFAHISLTTRYYDPSWWGRAEPIYITACPRNPDVNVGSVRDINFFNISAIAENGIFIAGAASTNLSGIRLEDIKIQLDRWTPYLGGLQDYRPGCQGLVSHDTVGIFLEYIHDVSLKQLEMGWGTNVGAGWGMPLETTPMTIQRMSLEGFTFAQSGEYSLGAHLGNPKHAHAGTRGDVAYA